MDVREIFNSLIMKHEGLPKQNTPEDVFFKSQYYQLDLDQQIYLHTLVLRRFPKDARSWGLLGLCYLWTLVCIRPSTYC